MDETPSLDNFVREHRRSSSIGKRITEVKDEEIYIRNLERHEKIEDILALRRGMYGLINQGHEKYHPCAYEFMKNVADDIMYLRKRDLRFIGSKIDKRLRQLTQESPRKARYVSDCLHVLLSDAGNSLLATEILSSMNKTA